MLFNQTLVLGTVSHSHALPTNVDALTVVGMRDGSLQLHVYTIFFPGHTLSLFRATGSRSRSEPVKLLTSCTIATAGTTPDWNITKSRVAVLVLPKELVAVTLRL